MKGLGDTGSLFDKGARDSAPVDTRPAAHSKPDAAAGNVILYPALNNASYRQGYDALRNRDPESALRFFEQAQKELSNDSMVRDSLQTARDMVGVRQLKGQDQKDKAAWDLADQAVAIISGWG